MRTLTVQITRELTPEMEALRRTGFHDATGQLSSADQFDPHSWQFAAMLNGELVGVLRMTPESPSVVQTWSNGRASVPTGPGVVDASRAVVAESARGLGIYKVLMTSALAWAKRECFKQVVGMIKPHFPLRDWMKLTGSVECGEPLRTYQEPDGETIGISICWSLDQCRPLLGQVQNKLVQNLKSKNIQWDP